MSARFDSEPIESGEQTLVPGVRPVTQRDSLKWSMTQPKAGSRAQKPCDLGLFDVNARNQPEQFIVSKKCIGVRRHLRRTPIRKLDEMLIDLIDFIEATQKKDT